MADFKRRLPLNVEGEFFVDATCIDCDTCRQLAPEVFAEGPGYSYVAAQPMTAEARRRAFRALVACPTASIGTTRPAPAEVRAAVGDFPLHLADDVYYCGFNSPKSYGGHSYFIRHPEGNWLVDAPRFVAHLVRRFEAMGGVRYVFFTHRDDVGDGARYAAHFGSRRIIHRADRVAQPDAEVLIEGLDPVAFGSDFLIIPTPGHTRGHCVLLYKSRFLFTGDHLWWDRDEGRLAASRSVCWYSWAEQTRSMERLQAFSFEWVLPGHGERVRLPADEMRRQLADLVEHMRRS